MRLGKKPGVINPPQSVYEKTRRQLKSPPVSARISSRDPITEGETPKIYKQRNPVIK